MVVIIKYYKYKEEFWSWKMFYLYWQALFTVVKTHKFGAAWNMIWPRQQYVEPQLIKKNEARSVDLKGFKDIRRYF